MALSELKLVLSVDGAGNVTGSLRDVEGGIDSLEKKTKSATGLMSDAWKELQGVIAGISLGIIVKESIEAALQMEKLQRQFTVFTGSASLAGKELEFIRNEANRLGMEVQGLTTEYGRFMNAIKGTTNEGEKGRKAFIGLSEGMAAIGMTANEQNRAWSQLNQGIMKGKFEMEDLKTINEAGLPIFRLLADALGITTGELLKQQQQGKILAEDVLPKLGESMHNAYGKAAAEAANSAQAQINRMNSAVFETKAAFGAALIPAFTDAVKFITPAIDKLKEFIGGLQILSIKMFAFADKTKAWVDAGGLLGMLSGKNRASFSSSITQINANAESTIDDLMKRYTPSGSDYSAAEKLRQAANKPTKPLTDDKGAAAAEKWASTYRQLAKEIEALNPIMSAHDKKLLDVSAKYAELERKKGANINKLRELKAQHLQAVETAYQTAEAIKATSNEFKEYLRIAGDESAWSQTADSVDEYHRKFRESVEDMDAATKAARDVANGIYDIERAFSEAGQSTAIETFINNLFKLKDVQNATTDINISMADSDPAAQQMAAIEERYRREAELIQQKLDALKAANLTETAMYQALSGNILAMASKREQDIANIQRKQAEEGWQGVVSVAQKAFPKLTGLDKAVTAAFKDHTKFRLATEQERAAGAQKLVKDETRSNLSMYSAYAGAAGAVFEGLAATQDTTSRAGFETAKAFNIAAAVMNTAMAITNALATVQPYPAAVAAAAMAGVMGAIQIATIASTTFGGSAQAPSVPSGSFGAGVAGGSSTVGTKIGVALQDPLQSASTDAMVLLAESAESASMAIGDLTSVFERIASTFEDGIGASLVSRAYGLYAGSVRATGNANMLDDRVLNEGISSIIFDAIKSLSAASVGLGSATSAPGAFGIGVSAWGSWTEEAFRGMFETLLKAQMDEFAKTVPGLEEYAKAGENASDALIRLSTALTAFNDVAELAGITLLEGLSGANMASKIADVMGGQDEMTEAIESYFEAVFTDAEQSAREAEKAQLDLNRAFARINADAVLQAKQNQQLYTEAWIDIDATTKQLIQIPKTAQQLADELNNVGIQVPKTREEFRNLVNSLDITTDSGASTFAALMKVSEAFGTVMTAADEAAAKLREYQDLEVRLLNAQGNTAAADALERQLSAERELQDAVASGYDAAYIARLKEVLALEEQAVTNSAALDVINNSLETANSAVSAAAGDFKTAIDTATKSLQDNANATKQALSDATGALDASYAAQRAIIVQQQQEVLESLTDGLDRAQAAADELQNTFNMLQSARQGMRLDGNSVSAWREASADLASILAAARNGDTSSIAGMGRTLDVVSNISTDGFTDQSDYQRAYWQTSNSIMELETLTGKQLTDTQQQVIALQNIIDLTKTGNDAVLQAFDDELSALKGISKNTLPIAEARANYMAAKQADDIAQAELKKQTDWMTSQYNALTAINSSVLSVSDAINRYMSAKDAVTKAQAAADAAKVASAATAINNSAVAGVSGGVDTVVVPDVVDTPASTASDLDSLIRAYVNDTVAVLGATDNAWMQIYNAAVANGISSSQLASAAGTNVADILAWTDMMGLPRFALGGITTGPSIAGEAGYPEAVVPLPDGRRIPVRMEGSADNRDLINEVRQLRAEVSALRSGVGQVSAATLKTAKALDRWDNDGMPEVRT